MSDKQLRAVWGAEEISKFLRVPLRKGYYLLEKELVPARKVGKTWVHQVLARPSRRSGFSPYFRRP